MRAMRYGNLSFILGLTGNATLDIMAFQFACLVKTAWQNLVLLRLGGGKI